MIDLMSLSKQCPDLNITVRATDLSEMVMLCASETKRQFEKSFYILLAKKRKKLKKNTVWVKFYYLYAVQNWKYSKTHFYHE